MTSNTRCGLRRCAPLHGLLWGLVLALASATGWAADDAPAVTSRVSDSSRGGGRGGADLFFVDAVDGSSLKTTALTASLQASRGRGQYLVVSTPERPVPSGRVRLRLRGMHAFAAPIENIFRSLFTEAPADFSGEISVELAASGSYRVAGAIDPMRREVWLEDERGAVVPGSLVTPAVDPEIARQMEGADFVTANLRYEDDWISEAPVLNHPFVPVGARLKVLDWGRSKVKVLINGHRMRLGIDYATKQETIQQFVAQVTSKTDPRPALAAWPVAVQRAIAAGKVMRGMTREQVLMALGRPRPDLVPDLAAPRWPYWAWDEQEVVLVFDEAGLLSQLEGGSGVEAIALYEPALSRPAAPLPPASASD